MNKDQFFTLIPKTMLILLNDHSLVKYKHIFKKIKLWLDVDKWNT